MFKLRVGRMGIVGGNGSAIKRAISTIEAMYATGVQGAWYDVSDYALMYQDSAGTLPVTNVEQPVGRLVDIGGRGNNALQATAINRPILSARYNLLQKSEAFDNALWVKTTGCTVVANSVVAPDGTTTADTVIYNGTGTVSAVRISQAGQISTLGVTYQASVWLRADAPVAVRLRGNNVAGSYITCNVTTEWRRFSTVQATGNGSTTIALQIYSPSLVNTAFQIYAWGGQVVSTIELPLNNYQSIDTATSYATDGFTKYLRCNGTNSSLASVAGGGGDAGFLFCQVIECIGGAGTVRKIFRDAGANTGYTVCINAANQLELSVGDGLTNTVIATVGTLAIGVKYLVTAWDDGVNLNVQIGAGAIASVARPAVVSGTAGFTLGASLGGTSNWLPADTNAIVYLAAAPTAAQVSSAQIYCRTKAGL